MEITERLIQQFLNRTCTEEEAEMVASYLYSNPSLLDKYFKEGLEEITTFNLSKDESKILLENIKHHTKPYLIKIKKIKKLIGIAASLLIFVCSYQFFSSPKKTIKKSIAQINNTAVKIWKFRMNNTNEEIASSLEDGTTIHLQPQSFVKYQSFDGQNKRDVFLTGHAFFKVAKDKTKPFTVYTGNITTTALGTQFSVDDNKQTTTIKLFEGKVVVKTIVANNKWKYGVYLTHGQELVFNKKDANYIVRSLNDTNYTSNKSPNKKKVTSKATTSKSGNWFMFNNQSLHDVFEQLGELYGIKIEYKNVDISKVYLIGKFEKTDSVEVILNNIALLKKLHIEHRENTYFITKN